jgi:hypothetical protein
MGHEDSLPCSQKLSIGHYPQQVLSSPQPTLCMSKIHCNIIFQFTKLAAIALSIKRVGMG